MDIVIDRLYNRTSQLFIVVLARYFSRVLRKAAGHPNESGKYEETKIRLSRRKKLSEFIFDGEQISSISGPWRWESCNGQMRSAGGRMNERTKRGKKTR